MDLREATEKVEKCVVSLVRTHPLDVRIPSFDTSRKKNFYVTLDTSIQLVESLMKRDITEDEDNCHVCCLFIIFEIVTDLRLLLCSSLTSIARPCMCSRL